MHNTAFRRLFLSLCLLLFSSAAFAGELLIPAVHRGPGAYETFWRTEIVISNASSHLLQPFYATLTLHRAGEAPRSIPMLLSSNETVVVADAVRDWFDLQEGGGIVLITWDQPQGDIRARARIYNTNATGEYGQSVAAVPTNKLESTSHLYGLSGVNGNRTNVGITNPTATDALVWISLFDTAGNSRGAFTTVIPARSYRSFNDIFSHFQAGPLDAATVQVSSTNTVVHGWASVVRNDTGDATFVTSR